MRVRLSGISTVVVTVATAACGVLMLGGIGPSPAGAGLTGEVLPGVVASSSVPATYEPVMPATSEPVDPTTTTSPETTTTTTVATSTTTTTTTTVATSTTTTTTTTAATSTTTTTTTPVATSTTTTTTTTTTPVPSPLPLSVSASQTVVGAGGTVDFAGTGPTTDGSAPGSLVVWVISETTEQIATGVTATEWTYQWTAPTDPNLIASHTFQFWCGDPSSWQGGYPADLQRTVDVVAQVAPTPTTSPLTEATPPVVIPETD